ncbi:putative LRR containing protein [Trachipleistophora hominis]|uniref:Putative LRR containing protein n=1 Tax=Trachipleistophora hominis TaxID=72359 RepID=L7JYM6_TRAHO|nr:putative LRR containing protein [Trachipleistophora hominis]
MFKFFTPNANETTPIKGSPDNLLILNIQNMEITNNMELSNYFEDVKLENITMKNNTKLVLNGRCKKLTIKNFNGIIGVGNVARFEMIEIHFPIDEQVNISFYGPVCTTKLYLYNVCKDVSNVKSALSNFRDVKNLKFENKSSNCFNIDEPVHVSTLKSIPLCQNAANKYVNTWSKYFTSKANSKENLFHAVSNVVINFIIEFLLNELKLELIENIELMSLTFAENN